MFDLLQHFFGSSTLYLLGSRLVDATQEGWLVYDVTSVLHEWILRPERNLGLKVTVETMNGRRICCVVRSHVVDVCYVVSERVHVTLCNCPLIIFDSSSIFKVKLVFHFRFLVSIFLCLIALWSKL